MFLAFKQMLIGFVGKFYCTYQFSTCYSLCYKICYIRSNHCMIHEVNMRRSGINHTYRKFKKTEEKLTIKLTGQLKFTHGLVLYKL